MKIYMHPELWVFPFQGGSCVSTALDFENENVEVSVGSLNHQRETVRVISFRLKAADLIVYGNEDEYKEWKDLLPVERGNFAALMIVNNLTPDALFSIIESVFDKGRAFGQEDIRDQFRKLLHI